VTESPDIVLRVAARLELAEEWALVLVAQDLSPSVRTLADGYAVCAPPDQAERAASVLSAYDGENRKRDSPREEERAGSGYAGAGLLVSGALLGFFLVTGPRGPGLHGFERGSADAERILAGELWRTVTALTLHADLGHALANALAGALFVGAVCAALGPGLGFALVVLSGAGGNLINALVQASHRVSVGASTAVFGAVGLLSGLAVGRRRRPRERRVWLPLAAGLAILAMLGTAGARVDPWAHLFGLLVGAALGVPVGFAVSRPPGSGVQWLLGVSAIAALLYCWARALH
jgi:membrane associated rhomboid family serine protease